MQRPTAIWLWVDSANAFTDYTDYVRKGTAITLALASVNNIWYVGFDKRMSGYIADLSTNGSYTTLLQQYFNGSWEDLSVISSYNFVSSKYCDWVVMDDWGKIPANTTDLGGFPNSGGTAAPTSVPDTIARYWFRIKLDIGGSQTTAAIISRFRILPYSLYCSPEQVASFLQLPLEYRFDYDSIPTYFDVEESIRQVEDKIDQHTHKSWRLNHQTDYIDFNEFGVSPVHHHDLYKVYSVAVWNGSFFETMTEGRSNEYFVDYDTGTIFFTRSYVLPLRFRVIKYMWRWDYGEYNRPIQIDYAYGYDSEINRQFKAVQRLATKMVAVELIENHAFGIMTVQGTDKLSYGEKIREWKTEIEDELERLSTVVMY